MTCFRRYGVQSNQFQVYLPTTPKYFNEDLSPSCVEYTAEMRRHLVLILLMVLIPVVLGRIVSVWKPN